MKKKFIVLGLIIVLSLLISVVGYVIVANDETGASSPALAACTTIHKGSENAINVVFLSDEETARKYTEFFLTSPPYDQNKDKFNFYNVDGEPSCKKYQGIAVYCKNSHNTKLASACQTDLIIAVSDEYPKSIRSSAVDSFLNLNNKHPMTVLLHEIGHWFGFAEEYKGGKIPRGAVNCQGACEGFDKFPGGYDSCHQECTTGEHYRSHPESYMRSLYATTYGIFNINRLQEEITKLTTKQTGILTGFATEENSDCSNQEYSLIEGTENGVTSTEKVEGCPPTPWNRGTFGYETDSEENSFGSDIIFMTDFNEDGIITSPSGDEENFILTIPETEGEITIKDPDGEIITTVDLNEIGSRPCKA